MPKNAWTKLKRRPGIDIQEWRRETIDWPGKGETLIISYGYLGKTRFRYYRHVQFPNGTKRWEFCLGQQKFTKEELKEHEERWRG